MICYNEFIITMQYNFNLQTFFSVVHLYEKCVEQ